MWRYVIHMLTTHPCMCMQIDTVKIVSIDCMLTLNVAHQTTKEGLFEAQAMDNIAQGNSIIPPHYTIHAQVDLEKTRKRRGRDQYTKVQSNLDYPDLGYLNPRLSELRSQAKVQVKVQISGTISMCACAVECSVAMVRYVRTNDS